MRIESEVARSGADQPRNLVQLLLAQAREPAKASVTYKKDGAWATMTWGQVLEEVKALSAGLVASGVKPGDRVALFTGTTLQTMLCDLAVAAAGGISVPIYASNTPDECRYILNDSGAVLLFVDHDEKDARQVGRLSRIRQRIAECPSVRHVVLFEGAPGGERESSLAELRRKGQEAHAAAPADFERRVAGLNADDVSTIIYTSGTTGDPKGVMQTHRGWTYQASSMERIRLFLPSDSVMLFLPFAHVFGQLIKSSWLSIGFKLIFAESPDKLLANMAETGPSVLPTVPRIVEKLYTSVVASGTMAPGLKGRLFRWAMGHAEAYAEARKAGREYSSLSFTLARRLVFDKAGEALRQKVGGNLRRLVTGSAPLSAKMGYTMELLGFVVVEGYGLTESTGVAALNPPGRAKIGTVGPGLPDTVIKLGEDGEVQLRGPAVMKGYFGKPEATAEALQADGWLRTGDIGELDADGYLRITDRKKDIIITAAGKNVAPQPLENRLKAIPLISQAMVYGDKRAYLTALVSVSEEGARKLLAEKGISAGTYAEVATRPEIREALQQAVDALNAALPPFSTLKKFTILEQDLTQENGELTPTSKVKRKFITQKYKALLDGMYEEKLVE